MKRVFIHYSELEEVQAGLWKIVRGEQRKMNIINASELMRDIGAFEWAMGEAIEKWPNSAIHNLTAESINRLAWLGHAGCCIAVGSPEENTRCAWHTLSEQEQRDADSAALRVLIKWQMANKEVTQSDLFEGDFHA